MRFQWYPFDQHNCNFRVGSFAFDKTKMTFRKLFQELEFSDVTDGYSTKVLDFSLEILPLDEKYSFAMRKGNYSLTGFKMKLKRRFLKYFLYYFLPSGLFVMASWVICFKTNNLKLINQCDHEKN